MDNTQPKLSDALAREGMDKMPSAVLVAAGGKVMWCNSTLLGFIKASLSDVVGQAQADMEKHYLKAMPEQPGLFFIMNPSGEEPEFWFKKQEIPLDDASLIVYENITDTVKMKLLAADLQTQLEELSTVDPVSGLLNRRAMLQNLEPLVSRSRRYNNPLSVISMELLDLEAIKQQYGEDGAHHVVKQVAFMRKDTLRWADLVSRADDDRFVFILPETDKEAAVYLARKINANITELNIVYESTPLPVNACFGVAAWEKGNDSVLLLRHANQSLDLAKEQGPGAVQDC